MKMAKLVILLLIFIAIMCSLSGCGNDQSESIKETFNQVAEDYIYNFPGETSYIGNLESLGIEAKNYVSN